MSDNSNKTQTDNHAPNQQSETVPPPLADNADPKFGNDQMFDDDMFNTFPEGTRIFIQGNSVTFENMTPDLLEVAQSLNPKDQNIAERTSKSPRKNRKKQPKLLYENASGKYFGSNRWIRIGTAKPYSGRKKKRIFCGSGLQYRQKEEKRHETCKAK